MRILTTPITCNGVTLANRVLVPGSILEQFMGLRAMTLPPGEAMLWHFKRQQFQLFDTFGCRHPIGYLALDKDKKVLQKGVMQTQRTKFIVCSYWIEVSPEVIKNVKVGDMITLSDTFK